MYRGQGNAFSTGEKSYFLDAVFTGPLIFFAHLEVNTANAIGNQGKKQHCIHIPEL